MATPNTAAKDEAASDFAADYGTATLTLLDGATVLATHTLAGFGASVAGLITANGITDVLAVADGTCDGAELTATGKTYTLTVSLPAGGGEVEISDLAFLTNNNSSVNSLTVQF